MNSKHIPFQETGYFSKLICDYLDQKPDIRNLYANFPNLEGFEKQILEKQTSFSKSSRKVLADSLEKQYKGIVISESTQEHINTLREDTTFTVVTGHQLNIFTGPLYFLYKIINTINLTKELKEKFPDKNFVPVYWMASEDHDFEEINHFFVNNAKISWDVESSGVVGKHTTESLDTVFQEFSKAIGNNINANYLKGLFQKSYIEHTTLTAATRYLVNELFGSYGLVIVDGDDESLKKEFSPFVKKELLEEVAFNATKKTNSFLEENYKVQVNPRNINLFYIKGKLRERIVFENDIYKINNTQLSFTKETILKELEEHPEYFSPNAILRPLYQEVILPNLCYIGGGGELAYWFQLKEMYQEFKVPFPILLLRNSVVLQSEKQAKKLERLSVSSQELFLKQGSLITKKTKELSPLPLDFSEQRKTLEKIFKELHPLVQQTDVSFEGALNAQEKKQLKGLANLEKRLLKAEKRNLDDALSRMKTLQDELFPRQSLQERNCNFAEFYVEYGEKLIPTLFQELKPLQLEFSVITL